MVDKKSIPWKYVSGGHLKSWNWKTEHFEVNIHGDGYSFAYRVTDLTSGYKKTIEEDRTREFKSAEDKILEVVSKSYPSKYGYRDYAGNLATTFLIHDGSMFDFGPYEGRSARLSFSNKGDKQVVVGSLQIKNHKIEISTDSQQTITLPPQFVISIEPEFGANLKTAKPETRTVQGVYIKGCTGKLGFIAGTVNHSIGSPYCPVHRI